MAENLPPRASAPDDDVSTDAPYDPNVLLEDEMVWRDRYNWLEEKGYLLRPRYRPEWSPSWGPGEFHDNFEDGKANLSTDLIDARRKSDNLLVMLKHIDRNIHPYEVDIGAFFSSEPLVSHPKNHCVPIYDVLDVPDTDNEVIIVMPLLREYDDPRIKSVGEAVEFFRQVFEGLQFMHQCHVAHRDCMNRNIMMDPTPIFPNMYHPIADRRNQNFKGNAKYYTRTARPTKYFLIDFGLSRKYNHEDGVPSEIPILSGDRTVPEFRGDGEFRPWNPFPTDIYYVGNMIREDFLQKTRGVEFIKPLVDEMVQDDPAKRPDINGVVTRFDEMTRSLSWWRLRSRLVELEEKDDPVDSILRSIHHFFRTTIHILTRRSPLPRP